MAVKADRSALGILESALGLLAGLVLAFSGYRLARGLAGLAGFLAGFVLGLVVGIVGGPVGSLVVGVVLGILFALLFVFAFRLVGAALGAAVAVALGLAWGWPAWLIVLAAIAGGVAGLVANKAMIVGATALAGASLAVESALELLYVLGVGRLADEALIALVGTLALAALGALSQWRSLRGEA